MSRPYATMLPLATSLPLFFEHVRQVRDGMDDWKSRDPITQLAQILIGPESNRLVAVPVAKADERHRHRALLTWDEEALVLQGLANRAKDGAIITSQEVLAAFSAAAGRPIAMSTARRFLKRHGFRVVYRKRAGKRRRRSRKPLPPAPPTPIPVLGDCR